MLTSTVYSPWYDESIQLAFIVVKQDWIFTVSHDNLRV